MEHGFRKARLVFWRVWSATFRLRHGVLNQRCLALSQRYQFRMTVTPSIKFYGSQSRPIPNRMASLYAAARHRLQHLVVVTVALRLRTQMRHAQRDDGIIALQRHGGQALPGLDEHQSVTCVT